MPRETHPTAQLAPVDGNGSDVGPPAFDITCVVGRVEYDPTAELSMHEQAFLIIASIDMPGRYSWPLLDGGTITVEVDMQPPPVRKPRPA